eukprot:SAG11_NODE_3757_length_2248_cov_2.761284_2_plen_208_part_00
MDEREARVVRVLWDELDHDSSGYLDVKEIKVLLGTHMGQSTLVSDPTKLGIIFRQLDADSSGKVEYMEFERWFATHRKRYKENRARGAELAEKAVREAAHAGSARRVGAEEGAMAQDAPYEKGSGGRAAAPDAAGLCEGEQTNTVEQDNTLLLGGGWTPKWTAVDARRADVAAEAEGILEQRPWTPAEWTRICRIWRIWRRMRLAKW